MKTSIQTRHINKTFLSSVMKVFPGTILTLAVCQCCSREPSTAQLDTAERMLFNNPDSAMSLTSELRTPRQMLIYNTAHYAKYREIDKELEGCTYTYYIEEGNECAASDVCLAKLLHGIRQYDEGDFTEAMTTLLKVEDDIHELPHAYFKGVAQFYIARIYLKEDLYENSLRHFRKELEYSKEIGSFPLIAKSSNHLSVVFHRIKEKDSVLYYMQHSLKYKDDNDSVELASIYNNLAVLTGEYYPDSVSRIERFFKKALEYKGNREYATLANMAELYYKHGRIPEANDVANKILAEAPEDLRISNARYLISRILYHYYDSIGPIDSAYKYQKMYLKYDSIENNLGEQKHIVALTERQISEKVAAEHTSSFWYLLALTVLLVLSAMISLLIYYRKTWKLRMEKSSLLHVLDEKDKELDRHKNAIKVQEKEKRILKQDVERNSMMQEDLKQSLSVVSHRLLGTKEGDIDLDTYYDTLYNELVKDKKENISFIRAIHIAAPRMKRREEIMCLLLYLEYSNEDICKIMVMNPGVYRTAKSRLKSKLSENKDKNKAVATFLETCF